jgi:hypothetical protein
MFNEIILCCFVVMSRFAMLGGAIDPSALINKNMMNKFAVRSDFCDVKKGDTYLGIHNKARSGVMYRHGGSSCKYLPFKDYNHSTVNRNFIYHHLPVNNKY